MFQLLTAAIPSVPGIRAAVPWRWALTTAPPVGRRRHSLWYTLPQLVTRAHTRHWSHLQMTHRWVIFHSGTHLKLD